MNVNNDIGILLRKDMLRISWETIRNIVNSSQSEESKSSIYYIDIHSIK
jgi:hypothetical protein